jgi:DNA-binding beta-propeller fold protein YncE
MKNPMTARHLLIGAAVFLAALLPLSAAQSDGWATPESIRGGLELLETFDSSGPDAWDVAAHPLVYFTSEGVGYNPKGGDNKVGFQIIDGYSKEIVASALYDMGEPLGSAAMDSPHGVGVSPDGQWVYVGFRDRPAETGEPRAVLLVINARTLKLHQAMVLPNGQLAHHITAFQDWEGRDRILVNGGRGAQGGPHFLLDPNDDNRVVRAITMEDTGYRIGHPYSTVDPTGRYLYVAVVAPEWRSQVPNTGGIAKIDLESGSTVIIPAMGDHPIGMAHTADGRFTYVAEGHDSRVYKIDNETNTIVGNASAGVAGPYGLALNWDETRLFTVGKGEGSHNTGGVLGIIDARIFSPLRGVNQPITLGGSASSIDHAILHPDPSVNELWISNMNGWETIVLDLDTLETKAYIPTPNGGDTHSGAFVHYGADWTGELLVDMGGPQKAMYQAKLQKLASN